MLKPNELKKFAASQVELVKVQKKILSCMESINRELKTINETYLKYWEGLQGAVSGEVEVEIIRKKSN